MKMLEVIAELRAMRQELKRSEGLMHHLGDDLPAEEIADMAADFFKTEKERCDKLLAGLVGGERGAA